MLLRLTKILLLWTLAVTAPPLGALEIKAVKPNLWLAQDSSLPLVAMSVVIKGGGDAYGTKAATATLAAMMLKNGGGSYDSASLAKRLEELSIKLNFATDEDTLTISLQTLRENTKEAFSLLKDVLTSPNFSEQDLAQAKTELVAAANARKQEPSSLARLYFYETMFKDHPYGRDVLANPAEVTRQDILAFIAALREKPIFIGMAGDISPQEAQTLVTQTFGEANEGNANINPLSKALPKAVFSHFTKDIPASLPQSVGVFALRGLAVEHPDYLALALLRYVFGGGFGSRLVKSIRQERGLVYAIGAYSNNLAMLPLVVGSFQTSDPAQVVTLLRAEITKIASEGITQQELARAKAYVIGSLAVSLTKLSAIANFAAYSNYYGRKPDYLQTRQARIEAITQAEVNELAKKLWGNNQFALLVLGEQSKAQ